jgi:HAD superfamily hydrolase (TIGR01509 family)
MLKAVIFDLDGVVADSHPIHEAAWKTLLVEQGLDSATLNLDFLYAGRPRREILRHYLGSIGSPDIERLGRRKDELYALAAQELKTKPGIVRVLSELKKAGILCTLATSAGRVRAHESLEQFGIAKEFSAIVTGEDAAVAKQAPEIFLLAAKKLDAMSKECVVAEDSVAGVLAARAAGMKWVGYALPRFAAALAGAGADDVISDFPEDSPTYFKHLVSTNGSQRSALQYGSPPARGR